MTSDRETRARDYHREVDDGSTWDLMSEEQRDCYRASADRLYSAWGSAGWQPIATAPTNNDRYPIQVCGGDFRGVSVAWWRGEIDGATHWQPMAAPLPETRSENTGGRDGR